MQDTLYYNVFSLLHGKSVTCEIPHYTHQFSIYNKTKIEAVVGKQYSSPLTTGFFIDANVTKTSNEERVPNNNIHTIRPSMITHVEGKSIHQFAKQNKLTEDGVSTVITNAVGRPRELSYSMDELDDLIATLEAEGKL